MYAAREGLLTEREKVVTSLVVVEVGGDTTAAAGNSRGKLMRLEPTQRKRVIVAS